MRTFTIDECIGNTPLVRLERMWRGGPTVLAKLEGNNPAGSLKDRPALEMVREAERSGRIKPGDTLIEASSGNTGIALAMVAAIRGYHMVVVMPEHMSLERRDVMRALGAKLVLTPRAGSMEHARDLAKQMEQRGEGVILNQYANRSNPASHYKGTGPEIWRDTDGRVTHFIAGVGTSGTLMGAGRFLKEQNDAVAIVGVEPDRDGGIQGIRAWRPEYRPAIFDPDTLDQKRIVSHEQAAAAAKALARQEGIFAGISTGANLHATLQIAAECEAAGRSDAVIVTIVCDRGDRYLSTGMFS